MSARSSAAALPVPYAGQRPTGVLAQQLLNVALFITIATSSIAFIEPSPHDALMFVLLGACIAARVPFERKLLPMIILLMAWLTGGFLALMHIGDQQKAIQYIGTSMYLNIAAIMFACLFAGGDLVRLAVMRRAYMLAALIAVATGYIGFFHLLPHSDIFLTNDRVSATFKDPNVFGPFLIFPLLLLIVGGLTRGIKFLDLTVIVILLGGLFFSFSRGAWFHFAVSAATAAAVLLLVTPDPRMRMRIVFLGIFTVIGLATFVVLLNSVGSIHDMFVERAKLIQPYDVGPGGRFWLQQLAIETILDNPNGVGPFEFDRIFGLQQHNVYMQGFLVYGWLGGTAYLTLVLTTLVVGLRAVRVPGPWQNYLVAAYAGFVGEMAEGMIVDTDHWRHFFLLLGLIWGLAAATFNDHRARLYAWQQGHT
jgi:O-Antigen ligase